MKLEFINLISAFAFIINGKIIRNAVQPQLGLHIFKMAYKDKQEVLL